MGNETHRRTRLSIVMPVLDEATIVEAALARLRPLRARGVEVVVVDGGSCDATVARAEPLADRLITVPRGRAVQMNAGARAARGAVLLFLHADTVLPEGADRIVLDGLAQSGRVWGRFDVRIEGRSRLFDPIARLMNLRSRLSGIATGDQALFARRDAFEAAGAYPAIALMEDVALSRALKRLTRPLCLTEQVITSGRRWERHGAWRTVFFMWRLRLAYFLGADPRRLAALYERDR